MGIMTVNGVVKKEELGITTPHEHALIDISVQYFGDRTPGSVGWDAKVAPQYYDALENSFCNIQRGLDAVGDESTVLITADHGGHDRTHGTDMPEDMTIPVFLRGQGFEPGRELEGVSIKDIAPTVCKLMGVPTPDEWEGNALL